MIEFVNIADHQDESAGLPSISNFVLQKIQKAAFWATRFLFGRTFHHFVSFFEIQKSGIQSGDIR